MIRAKNRLDMFNKGLPSGIATGLGLGIGGAGLGDIATHQVYGDNNTPAMIANALGAGGGALLADYIARNNENNWQKQALATEMAGLADPMASAFRQVAMNSPEYKVPEALNWDEGYQKYLGTNNNRAKLIGLQLLAGLGLPIVGSLIGGAIGDK